MKEKDVARFWAKVDKTGECWLWTGACNSGGYGTLVRQGKKFYAHRYSFAARGIEIPAGMLVDHICHTLACVRPDHLRIVTQKQNMENLNHGRSGSKSGIRGLSWNRPLGKWQAVVRHHGVAFTVGYFDDLAAGEAAVIAKRNELFTHNDADRVEVAA